MLRKKIDWGKAVFGQGHILVVWIVMIAVSSTGKIVSEVILIPLTPFVRLVCLVG